MNTLPSSGQQVLRGEQKDRLFSKRMSMQLVEQLLHGALLTRVGEKDQDPPLQCRGMLPMCIVSGSRKLQGRSTGYRLKLNGNMHAVQEPKLPISLQETRKILLLLVYLRRFLDPTQQVLHPV